MKWTKEENLICEEVLLVHLSRYLRYILKSNGAVKKELILPRTSEVVQKPARIANELPRYLPKTLSAAVTSELQEKLSKPVGHGKGAVLPPDRKKVNNNLTSMKTLALAQYNTLLRGGKVSLEGSLSGDILKENFLVAILGRCLALDDAVCKNENVLLEKILGSEKKQLYYACAEYLRMYDSENSHNHGKKVPYTAAHRMPPGGNSSSKKKTMEKNAEKENDAANRAPGPLAVKRAQAAKALAKVGANCAEGDESPKDKNGVKSLTAEIAPIDLQEQCAEIYGKYKRRLDGVDGKRDSVACWKSITDDIMEAYGETFIEQKAGSTQVLTVAKVEGLWRSMLEKYKKHSANMIKSGGEPIDHCQSWAKVYDNMHSYLQSEKSIQPDHTINPAEKMYMDDPEFFDSLPDKLKRSVAESAEESLRYQGRRTMPPPVSVTGSLVNSMMNADDEHREHAEAGNTDITASDGADNVDGASGHNDDGNDRNDGQPDFSDNGTEPLGESSLGSPPNDDDDAELEDLFGCKRTAPQAEARKRKVPAESEPVTPPTSKKGKKSRLDSHSPAADTNQVKKDDKGWARESGKRSDDDLIMIVQNNTNDLQTDFRQQNSISNGLQRKQVANQERLIEGMEKSQRETLAVAQEISATLKLLVAAFSGNQQ